MSKPTQNWEITGHPEIDTNVPSSQTITSALAVARDGINAALADYYGASDPSATGVSWGADQVGRTWLDATNPLNLVTRRWSKLDSTPTYGWRILRTRKVLSPAEVVTVDFSGVSPFVADTPGPWTTVDLSTLLDSSVQDAAAKAATVVEVLLEVELTPGASETVGAANCYMDFRRYGATNRCARVKVQVATIPVYAHVRVPLSSEKFDYLMKVGGGTPSLAVAVSIVEATEVA